MSCNSFKNNSGGSLISPSILTFPCCRTIFPFLVHAINTPNHPREPPHFTNKKYFLQVILSWGSKIHWLIQLYDSFTESTQTLQCCSTSYFDVFIDRIGRHTICQHSHGRGTFC